MKKLVQISNVHLHEIQTDCRAEVHKIKIIVQMRKGWALNFPTLYLQEIHMSIYKSLRTIYEAEILLYSTLFPSKFYFKKPSLNLHHKSMSFCAIILEANRCEFLCMFRPILNTLIMMKTAKSFIIRR